MNIVERMEIADRVRSNVAKNMIRKGRIISDRERSNYYAAVRIIETEYRGSVYSIIYVDGLVCRIEKEERSTKREMNRRDQS